MLIDENKFIVFERKVVLRKINGPVEDDITGEWRRRRNNIELKTLYSGVDIS